MQFNHKTLFITLFASLFLLVPGTFVRVSLKLETTRTEEVSDNLLALFRHRLDREKSNALFLSVALSDNKALKEALKAEDEEVGYHELIETLEKVKTYTFVKDIRTQIITKDLDIFARSWENDSFAGMPLEGFRSDLQRIRRLRKPKVSIDPGRLLTIKATTPVKEGVELLGYIEAIKTFDEITESLRLLESVPRAERKLYEEEAREILQGYTREELIDVILQLRHKEKKRGEIR